MIQPTADSPTLSLEAADWPASPIGSSPPAAGGVLALAPNRPAPDDAMKTRVARPIWPVIKRGIDIASALGLLAVMMPLLALIAVAIKLDSSGPVFYRVRRVGHRGRPLPMLKFRKMHDDAAGGPLTTGGDPRLTRVGAWLTRTRLDELPQLWDVLRGRMSLVGPRPEDPEFVSLHPADYDRILCVRPGMTGLSQLAYAGESHILDLEDPVDDYLCRILPQKLGMDKLYATESSLGLDLSILRWTIVTLLLRRPVAVNRSTAQMNVRRRRIAWSAMEPSASEAAAELAAEPMDPTPAPSYARKSVA